MKIGERLQPTFDTFKGADLKKAAQVDKLSFGDLVKSEHQRLSQERLNQLLQEIDKQAQLLARSRSVRDFYAYKNLVKRFMEEAVKYGVALEDRRGVNRRGRSRLYKIVKQVDEQLLLLADELLEEQGATIDLLARIGEIRGMLINLYF
ncbi:YaaR family protein [Brevibacillus humidisoli]|uniref:YaaR family protein n=1 Tax=Brevibacillus humidisoli TaxID=2895522 RepID=UPI001E44D403|nr:YaaR family protein [Brevibacillus humidisoli]UFJ40518.1 YaaR family protein [Brevibacillus humidisoli]